MRQDLEEELFDMAPHWFNRTYLRQSLMSFSFECGDGWFDILKQLMTDLITLTKCEGMYDDFQVTQVKEKYGTLRFYTSYGSSIVWAVISSAENRSGQTCEICGDYGRIRSRGYWYRTLCIDCAEKEGYDLSEWESKRQAEKKEQASQEQTEES
jgi:hypothetical protein